MNTAPLLYSRLLLLVCAICSSVRLCARDPEFVDVTERSGIGFLHRCGSPGKKRIDEVNGSGVALFDCDQDGDLDVYLVNAGSGQDVRAAGGAVNGLYRNDGGWKFTDITALSQAGDPGWGSGAAVADVDNDGRLDLYVTNRGPNALYRNLGGGRFRRLADSGTEVPAWSTSSSFADFDSDGLVDLYVANYLRLGPGGDGRKECEYKGLSIFCGPGGMEAQADVLLKNMGGGKFRDVSREWGLHEVRPSYGLGTLVVDIGRDGHPDLIVANDTRENFCFLNKAGRSFQEAALFLGLAYNDYGIAQAGMGLASGDVSGRQREAVFMTHFEDDTNTLYLPGKDGLYDEGTFPAGLGSASYPYLGWGTFFFDAEGDGDLDLFVANGHVAPQVDGLRSTVGYRQRNQLFLNGGRGIFKERREALPDEKNSRRSSRGAACGDLDGDGDPDIVVNNIDARPTVLENRSAGRWLEVRLRGRKVNRSGIGARVTVSCGGQRQERYIQSGMSWASQCELSARFGLVLEAAIDEVRVDWPGGAAEIFSGIPRQPVITLVEGEGKRPKKER